MDAPRGFGNCMRDRNCDVKIITKKLVVWVHKSLVQQHSKFLRGKLATDFGNPSQILLDDLNEDGVEWCIEYMYSGNCPPKRSRHLSNLQDIVRTLEVASVLQMGNVKEKCLEFVLKHLITTDNCLEAVEVMKKYGTEQSIQDAQQFVQDNFEKVLQLESFLTINNQDLLTYIRESHANAKILWKAITLWVEYCPQRKSYFSDMIDNLLSLGINLTSVILDIYAYPIAQSGCKDLIVTELNNYEQRLIDDMSPKLSVQLIVLTSVDGSQTKVHHRLRTVAIDYMSTNTAEVTQEMIHLSFNDFKGMLQSLAVSNFIHWMLIVNWTQHDETRMSHLLDLIKTMDMENVTPRFIDGHMRDFIKSSNDCLNFVLDHLLRTTKHRNTSVLAVYESNNKFMTLLNVYDNTYSKIRIPAIKSTSRITSLDGELYLHHAGTLLKFVPNGTWVPVVEVPDYSQTWTQFNGLKAAVFIISKQTMLQYNLSCGTKRCQHGCGLGNGFSSTCSDSQLYAVGGSGTENYARIYHPYKGWRDLPNMPVRVCNPATAYYGHNLYVVGGYYAGKKSNAVACFDGQTWTMVANMLRSRSNFAAHVFNDKLIVIGGSGGMFESPDDMEEYDNNTKIWKRIGIIDATKEIVSLGTLVIDQESISFTSCQREQPPHFSVSGRIVT